MMILVRHPGCGRAFFLSGAVFVATLGQGVLFAQVTSVSPSLSGSIAQSTSTSGLNGTFDAESSNFSNPALHTDVSDPTHAQLLGSSLSPADIPAVNAFVNGTPETGTLSDAQLAVRYGETGSARHRGSPFASSATLSSFGGAANPQGSPAAFSTATQGGAFSGSAETQAAFVSRSLLTSPHSFTSNEGKAVAGSGTRNTRRPYGTEEGGEFESATATDPVLTGASSSYESDLQLEGDMPSPSADTARFFATGSSSAPQYQYEDGQTPPLRTAPVPGSILGIAPEYGPASNGFPDSTRGLAGLPSELANSTSPLERKPNQGFSFTASPDPSPDSGLRQHLNPDLHALPLSSSAISFQAYERQMRAQRLRAGLSITQSSMLYQQDLKNYQQRRRGRTSRSRVGQSMNSNDSGLQQQFMSSSVTH